MKVPDTNHLDMWGCLRQSPDFCRKVRVGRNGIWARQDERQFLTQKVKGQIYG